VVSAVIIMKRHTWCGSPLCVWTYAACAL